MCGITGLVRPGRLEENDTATVKAMTETLRHRGPDGSGILERRQVVLGHRRLAVIDLSDRASQPMVPDDAEVAITYNGEVYNHVELRRELENHGYRFQSRSDTEVALQGWRAWGEALPQRLNGMFALGIWDAARQTLFLARDRFGQKPLFYAPLPDGGLAFASELRALREVPEVDAQLDRLSLAKYLCYDGFPGESTPFQGVRKLLPGHSLTWRAGRLTVQRYWQPVYGTSKLPPKRAAERLWQLLRLAVQRRLMSDVPLGVFLSGGLDSSAVLAAMCSVVEPSQIQTFAVGFQDASYDESRYARTLAEHFGVQHHELVLSNERLLQLLPELLDHMDEPLADASLVPTFALTRFARQHVTVALGGDGGDELLAGYDTWLAERVARPYLWVPGPLRRGVSALVDLLPASTADMSLQFKARRFVQGLHEDPLERNLRWFGSFLAEDAAKLILGLPDAERIYEDLGRLEPPPGIQSALELWRGIYLPSNILTKVDRASMAVSLEARAPFLDAELAEFLQALPFHYKLHGTTRKWILKRAMRRRLPSWVMRRRKQGFRPPHAGWLRGPLRQDAERLLSPQRLARGGLLDPTTVARLLQEHLSGAQDHRKQLWALYVLESWRERSGLA
jgi:asparagine synthase (glutamine-hydrolysing)